MIGAVIDCSGTPREVGYAQGRACRETLREEFARCGGFERMRRWLGQLGATETVASRELSRHFPHQAESLEGLARGAGVPYAHLVGRLVRAGGEWSEPPRALAAIGGALQLARPVPPGAVLRRTCPEPGFRTLELARPDLTPALAGVNEKGLAGAVAHRPGALASLLLADCLLRFEALDAALDWCLGRPAGGRAVVLLADASGEAARVELDGEARRVRRGIDASPGDAPRPGFVVDPRECRAALVDAAGEHWYSV